MIILNSLRRAVARTFLNSVRNRTSKMYLFFGQINDPVDSPPEADGIDYINYTRNNIFALKELLPSDVSFVVPRVDYTPDKVYSPYDSSDGYGDYVLNPSIFSVYVCVKAGEGDSTVMPSHTTTAPVESADGYVWRYIYTIPLALRDKFLTALWIPVSNTLSESYFSDGGIDSVSILDSGDGYLASNTSILVTGANGTGTGAILSPVIVDGKIVSVSIHETGYGYKSPTITILSPTETRKAIVTSSLSRGDIRSAQALIQTLAVPGTLESVEIVSGGLDYTSNVQLTLTGDGQGGSISFARNSSTGEITDVEITDRGEGYSWAKIIVTDELLIGGSGAEFRVNISRSGGFGKDAVADLNATDIMVYQNFSRESLSGLQLENKIYKFGLIDSPKTPGASLYPKDFVTVDNYVVSLPTAEIANYPIGTLVYNEFPTTLNTKSFRVEEQIVGVKQSGIRLKALNGGRIVTANRYYKNSTTSFTADAASYQLSVDRQMVSACYTLEGTGFDINTFTVGSIVTKDSFRYVIVATSTEKILVSSIDGGVLNTGDELTDGHGAFLSPTNILPPLFDKKSGSLLTIENSEKAITYGPQQTVSFRTVLKF